MRIPILLLLALTVLLAPSHALGVRIKDIAHVEGVRPNQLIGYGLVVGLDGTGDGQRAGFTVQSLAAMLSRMGIRVDPSDMMLRNVAAVMVTGTLPAFAQPGSRVDVTVSSIGNARSLVGGTLLLTPLSGVDGRTYGMAQGPLEVGGYSAEGASGSRSQKNHLNVGRVPAGGLVEDSVAIVLTQGDVLTWQIDRPDFTTARSLADSINNAAAGLGAAPGAATVGSSGAVHVQIPPSRAGDIARFIADVEGLELTPDAVARVVINGRTGTIVMGDNVRISTVAVAHGALLLEVEETPEVSQPGAFAAGNTAVVKQSAVTAKEEEGVLRLVEGGATLADLVRALNALGAKPRELIAILQAIDAAGALHGELEVL